MIIMSRTRPGAAGLVVMAGLLMVPALACQAAPTSETSAAADASTPAAETATPQQEVSPTHPPAIRTITAAQAKDNIGEEVAVCGHVVMAVWVQDQPRKPTYLNFDRPWPEQVFSAIVRNEDRANFPEPPEQTYADKDVCVTGTIIESDAGPQMRIDSPEDITIQEPKKPAQ